MTAALSNAVGWSAMSSAAPTSSDRDKLAGVAKQFEAIFVRQMLAAARKSDFGGDLFGGDGAIDTFREMQDSQFADIAADTGTLGLAQQIEAHLARFVDSGKPAAPAAAGAPADKKS